MRKKYVWLFGLVLPLLAFQAAPANAAFDASRAAPAGVGVESPTGALTQARGEPMAQAVQLLLADASGLPAAKIPAAKLEVQADLQDVGGVPDIDGYSTNQRSGSWKPSWDCAHGSQRAVEVGGLAAEPVVVVFNKAGKPIQESVFAADSHGPTAPSIADTADGASSYTNGHVGPQAWPPPSPRRRRLSRSLGSGPTHIQPGR